MLNRVDSKDRTFETRLLFLKNVFSNLYEKEQILTSGIEHKLKRSYEVYIDELNKSVKILETKNPITILKKSNKEIKENK